MRKHLKFITAPTLAELETKVNEFEKTVEDVLVYRFLENYYKEGVAVMLVYIK